MCACGGRAVGRAAERGRCDAEYEDIVSALRGNELVCDDLKNAIGIAKKCRGAFRIVTSDGCDLCRDGSGINRAARGGCFAAEREIRKAEIVRLKSMSD